MNEAVSEGLTLGAGGLFVVYALAIPALTEFDENKINDRQVQRQVPRPRRRRDRPARHALHNDAVPLEDLPDHLIKATLATEDRRFFEHFGVDFLGTARALVENARANEVVQGGSTLTQQLAKNLFLSAERSIQRKVKEAYLAFLLESRFTKREILKLYLDRAYMGGGAFGVEAASQFYFGHSVRELTLAESALLAGLFKAPAQVRPAHQPAGRAGAHQRGAEQHGRGRLHERGPGARRPAQPRQDHRDAARLQPRLVPRLGVRGDPAGRRGTRPLRADRAHHHRRRHAAVGPGRHDRRPCVRRRRGAAIRITGAMVAMEPDGAVRAMVGGLDYGESQFNRASHAHRQPGSSFKLYVYATAFEHGYGPKSMVRDYGGACGNWAPKNYSGGGGSGRTMTGHRRLQGVAQRAGRRPVAARRPREGAGDDAAAGRRGRQEDLLDGARRHRHHAAAAHRRLRHLRQRRQAVEALRHPGDLQLQGRPDLHARARRAGGPAGGEPQGRRGHEPDDAGRGAGRHRPSARSSTSPIPRARPAPAPAIATPGSSASPARW